MLYLFGPKETDFINGNSDLIHHTYDEVVDRSKGFYLKFKMVLDKDKSYKKIKKEMIINAHTPDGWNQFRVFDIYNHSNYVEVVATQLHYDLNYKKVFPFAISKATAQIALNLFVQNFKSDLPNFKFTSSITDVHNFSTDDDLERLDEGHNALEILNRIASRWGGELEVDGYNVKLVPKLGKFTNALLYEHKNIAEFVDETSLSEVVTRIHAVSRFRPERAEGSTEEPEEVVIKVVVDSPLIDEYAQVYEEDYTNNDARTRDELISWARLKYSTNNIDKPARSIKVETNIIDGQEINYGDDLVLKYTKHDVDEIIRCVGYQYNPNSKQYISITLGSNSKTLSSTITGSVHDSTKNQLSNIAKQVQIIRYASNNVNRVTTGPLPIPDPIEGDMWFYHPEGRPNEVELRIFQNGGWETIVSDMTGENVRKTLADLELEAEGLAEDIAASDQKAEAAKEEAGLAKNAVDAFGIITQETADKMVDVEQIVATAEGTAADALAEASQAKTDATDALAKARESATNSSGALALAGQAATDSQTAIDTAEAAKTDAQTAISNAATAKTDSQTAIDKANTAQTDAQTAIDNASAAQTDAQTAIDNANAALSTAGSADGKADQAIAKANAIPTTITGIIEDKNLVNGSYVDTKVDAATGAWSQELVRVEGKIPTYIGGRNYFSYAYHANRDNYTFSSSYNHSKDPIQLEPNTEYIMSYEDLVRFDSGQYVLFMIDSSWNRVIPVFNVIGMAGTTPPIRGGNKTYTFTTNDDGLYRISYFAEGRSYDNTPEGKWITDIFLGFQIEKGNVATDWSPAPEDLYSQEEFKLFNAQYTQDVEGMTGRLTTVENNKLDGTTFQTFKQSEYQVTADKVASTVERVDTAEGKITTQGTAISQNASDIATKANTTTVNTLTGRVDTAESNISQNATAITQRVTTTTYNTGLGTKENSVLKQSTAPAHLNGRLWLDTSVTPNILKRSTGTAWVKATPTTASEVGAYSSSQGSALAGRVTTAETNISQTSEAITSKADKSVVDTLSGTVSTHTTTLSQHATDISSKASQTEVDTVKGTVSTHTSTLSQHASDISARLTQTQVDNLVNDKGYSTVSYVDTEISATAGAIRTEMTAVEGKIPLDTNDRNYLTDSETEWETKSFASNSAYDVYRAGQNVTDMFKELVGQIKISVDVFIENAELEYAPFRMYGTNGSPRYELNNLSFNNVKTNEWVRVSGITSIVDNGTGSYGRIEVFGSGRTSTTKIRLRKFKIGKAYSSDTWSPAPEDMLNQSDFNTFKASYEQSAEGWNTKLLQIEQADYASKTWSNQTFATPQSVSTQLESYAKTTDLNGLVTETALANKSYITSSAVNTLLTSYAKSTDLNGLATESYVGTKINTTAEGIRTEITAVENKIPTEIGGRNLQRDITEEFVRSVNTVTVVDDRSLLVEYRINTASSPYVIMRDTELLHAGQEYTLSFYATLYRDSNTHLLFGLRSTGGFPDQVHVLEPEVRTKITHTFKPTANGTPSLILFTDRTAIAQSILFEDVKLEKGSIATDWTPALEDMLNQRDFTTFKAEYDQSAEGWSTKLLQIEQANYATQTWSNETFATPQSVSTLLNSYAKTTDLNGMVTETTLANKNFITASSVNTLLTSYAKTSALNGMVTETSLANKNFVTSSEVTTQLQSYAKTTDLNGMVTETTLENKNYATASSVNTLLTSYAKTTDLNGLATESYVGTEISSTAGAIRTEMTAVENKIPTKIGGRNYLTSAYITSGIERLADGEIYDFNIGRVGTSPLFANLKLEKGKYIFHILMNKPAGDVVASIRFHKNGSTISYYGRHPEVDGEWNRLEIPFEVTNESDYYGAQIYNHNFTGVFAETVKVMHLMIEKGDIASDWAPSPEDMLNQTDFNTFKAEYEQSAQGWSSKLQQIENADYATKTWSNQTFATPQSVTTQLSSYAKTTALNGMVTETTLATKNFITASAVNTLLTSYAKSTDLNGMVTETSLANKNYATASSVTTQLQSYAKTTDLNGLATETYVGSQISATAGTIRSEITAVEGKIDGLEIGGRNLISYNYDNYVHSTYAYTELSDKEEQFTLKLYEKDSTVNMSGIYLGFTKVGHNGNSGVLWAYANGSRTGALNSKLEIKTNSYRFFSFYPRTLTTLNTILARYDIKVERGNRATDWSPAPEDMATSQQVSSIQQTADSIQSLVGTTNESVARAVMTSSLWETEVTDVIQSQLTETTTSESVYVEETSRTDLTNLLLGGSYSSSIALDPVRTAGVLMVYVDIEPNSSGSGNGTIQVEYGGVTSSPVTVYKSIGRYEYLMSIAVSADSSRGGLFKFPYSFNGPYDWGTIRGVRVEKATTIQVPVGTGAISSKISQLYDQISLALTGADGQIAHLIANASGVSIKGEIINLDGKVKMDEGFARKFMVEQMTADTVDAFSARFANAIVGNLDVNNISGNKASFIQSSFLSATGNSIQITGDGLTSMGTTYQYKLDKAGINYYASGNITGVIRSYNDENNNYSGLSRGTSWITRPGHELHLGYGAGSENGGGTYSVGLALNGTTGRFHLYSTIMAGSSNLYGIDVKWGEISGATTGVRIMNRQGNGGIQIDNNDIRYLGPNGWRSLNVWLT